MTSPDPGRDARWNGQPPTDFAATLLAARLYVCFHWIFSGSFRGDEPRIRSHLEGILDEAIRWGILPGDASGTMPESAGSDLHAP